MGCYRFGEFELDLDVFALKHREEARPLQPKVFDVLRHLIERRGTVVTKSELLREIWHDEDVYDGVIYWSMSHIRRALGQRGRHHPIETVPGGYRFIAEVSEVQAQPPTAAAAATASSTPLPPLIGRASVMAELAQHLSAAARGRGALCVITGEAGIGKTRCAEELAVQAQAMGVEVLWGRCPQDLAVPPLWPIAAAFTVLARKQPELVLRARELIADTTAITTTAPQVQIATTTPQAQGEGRFFLIERGADLLRELAAKRPTLFILDDLHWADAASLELLSFLGPELSGLPLCVVGTLRDGELQPGSALERPLRRVLQHARAIPLDALDAIEVAELAQRFGHDRPSQALADALQRVACGVPLFVHEILRTLAYEHGDHALANLAPDAIMLPALARDLLGARIARLPLPTRELLGNAAVIGDNFDLSLLMALVELEPEQLIEQLEPALLEGQLQCDSPVKYRFKHSLFRTVLYEALAPGQRINIHRKLGSLLLETSVSPQRESEAARHLYLALPAADPQLVMQVARSAGDAAQTAFAHENAIVHYGWALEAQLYGGAVDSAVRAKLLLSLCTAQRMAGRTSDALETSARVLEVAQQQHMSDIVVRAVRLRRPTVAMSMLPDALSRAALEAVIEQLPDQASTTRVSALAQLACIPPYSTDLARSKQLSARALELASELGDADPMLEAMRARLFSLGGPDDLDELLQVAQRMSSMIAQGPSTFHAGDARTARYTAHILAGRIADADATLREMTASVSTGRFPEAHFFYERLVLQRQFLDGNFAQADDGWKRLHARAVRAGVAYADLFYGTHALNLLYERQGASATPFRSRLAGSEHASLTPYTRATYARHAAEAGELDIARSQLAVLGDPHGFPRDAHYLHLLSNLAACASRVGDEPRCEQLLSLLSPYASFNTPSQMGYYLGSVSHFLGLLAAALRRGADAEKHFTRAAEHNQAMGYRPGVARTLLAHGRLALALGKSEAAQALLAEASGLARALGMNALLKDADALSANPKS